jgi:hypothetical protein
MHHVNTEMQACIDACLACYRTCTETAYHHCLRVGGDHVAPAHFTLLASCAEICRSAAHFMLMGSEHHRALCRECAEICEECATDCERLGDMDECVRACRQCAESCRAMAA